MKVLKHITFIIVIMQSFMAASQQRYDINTLLNDINFTPNKQYSLVVEITNRSTSQDSLIMDIKLPSTWKLITKSHIPTIEPNKKKLAFISFDIPQDYKPGNAKGEFILRNNKYKILQKEPISFTVIEQRNLEVNLVSAPDQLQAGETYKATYAIENKGNIVENVILNSTNTKIVGKTNLSLAPSTTTYVDVELKTSPKVFALLNLSSDLKVSTLNSDKTYRAHHLAKVFPVKIKSKDQFFRFPIEASYLYNSYFSNRNTHYSLSSFEVKGHGHLDTKKNKYLDFIIRGPNHINAKRFSSYDRYSLTYANEKSKTKVTLGDYGLRVNNLALMGRYGMGVRVDQKIDKWTLSGFYTKPRFYKNNNPIYGAQFSYNILDSLSFGASVIATKGKVSQYFNPSDEDAQIITLETAYQTKNTQLVHEVSTSLTNTSVDFGNYLRLSQRFGRFYYTGNLTYTGKEYMGSITNSFSLANSLNIPVNLKSYLQIGQSLSKINERLDELTHTILPYYERYFINYRFRFNRKNRIDIRFTKRLREDKLDPKSYHYKENILRYDYRYSTQKFTFNVNGQYGKSKNLLLEGTDYRDTYGTGLGFTFRSSYYLSLNGNIGHTYTGKYSNIDTSIHYMGYGGGFDLNIHQDFRFNFNYNNSFNPELTYTSRDYISANMMVRFSKNHQFEIRTNYFTSPGQLSQKEFYGYAKYTCKFRAPLKRILELGSAQGQVTSNLEHVDLNGIAIKSTEPTVKTNALGFFELNNLPIGINYIFVDESTLQKNIIVAKKMPLEITVTKDGIRNLEIPLVEASKLSGKLTITTATNYNLSSFLKLESNTFTYHTESSANGSFSFKHIVPGNYKLTILKLKNNPESFNSIPTKNILIKAGENKKFNMVLSEKVRKVKFNNTNFKVKM